MNSAVEEEEQQLTPQFSNYKYIFTDGKINSLGWRVSIKSAAVLVNMAFTVMLSRKCAREEPSALHQIQTLTPPPSHTDRRSGGAGRQGDGMSGRSQVQQGADRGGHLGEPALLQDVQGETQVTLMATHKTQEGKQWKRQ